MHPPDVPDSHQIRTSPDYRTGSLQRRVSEHVCDIHMITLSETLYDQSFISAASSTSQPLQGRCSLRVDGLSTISFWNWTKTSLTRWHPNHTIYIIQ